MAALVPSSTHARPSRGRMEPAAGTAPVPCRSQVAPGPRATCASPSSRTCRWILKSRAVKSSTLTVLGEQQDPVSPSPGEGENQPSRRPAGPQTPHPAVPSAPRGSGSQQGCKMRPGQAPQCGTQRSNWDSKPWCQHAAEREATRLRHCQREMNCWPTETPKKLPAQGDPKTAGVM